MARAMRDLPPVQTGPAAWSAADVDANRDWIIELSAADLDELAAAAAPFATADALASITRERFVLPTLGPRLVALQNDLLHGRGFALLRGVPVDSPVRAAAMFLGIGAHLGRARSQNAKGHGLGHVFDLGLSGADPNV